MAQGARLPLGAAQGIDASTEGDNTVSDLVQIVYVSRSTFTTMPAELGIEPSVARILAQSRVNNARRGLVGALYFGDGCFFQCLEGRTEDVERLYAALLRDPRHTDLKVLVRRPIERTSFAAWSMKYVPLDAEMKTLLRALGLQTFDPYRFDEATVTRVLEMLGTGRDLDRVPAVADETKQPAADAPRPGTAPAAWKIAAIAVVAIAVIAGIAASMGAFG